MIALAAASIAGAATTWPQFDFDSQHSGNNTQETMIDRSSVTGLSQRYQVTLPSIADGAPAYLPGVSTTQGTLDLLFLTTKAGHILAVDAATGSIVWSHQYAAGSCRINNGSNACYTTSSPAVDPGGAFVYGYGLDGKVHQYRVGDGVETTTGGWPQVATLKGFDEKGSSALSIAVAQDGHARLYVTNGGYPGDRGDYQGHVTSIDLASGSQNVFNANCSDQAVHFVTTPGTPDCAAVQTAVWARPGVVYEPTLDRLFFATGNGNLRRAERFRAEPRLGRFRALHSPGRDGIVGQPSDSYTPSNFQQLDDQDLDLGSTAPAILPSSYAGGVLAVQSGKDSKIRLLNLSNLSGQGGPSHLGGEIQIVSVPQGGEVLTHPAVWVNPVDQSTWFFVANGNGISGFKLTINGMGAPSIASQWSKSGAGSSPVLANGVLFDAGSGALRALNPETGAALWSSTQIGGIHWESPIVADGVVYVTDESAHLTAFALPAGPGPAPNVDSFTATPSVLESAGASTLAWATSRATSVTISGVSGSFSPSGNHGVSVGSTTSYTLTATGPGGSASAVVTVDVLPSGGTALAQPAISAPTPGQVVGTTNVNFSWGAVAGADGYGFRIFNASNGQTELTGSTSGSGSTSAAAGLAGGAHTFAVRACAGGLADANCGPYGTVGFSVHVSAPASSQVKFFTLTPCRIADTRNAPGPFGGPALAAETGRVFTLAGRCGIPSGTKAVSLNLTIVTPSSDGSLQVNPTGTPPGSATAMSFSAGRVLANNAIVFLGTDGAVVVTDGQITGAAGLVIDTNGYFK